MLPYSLDAYFSAVARMNADLALFSLIALLLGLFLLALTWWPALAEHKAPQAVDRRMCLALAAGWLASGAVFYGDYLEPLFFAAPWFLAGFIAQAVILLTFAVVAPPPMRASVTPTVWAGRLLMLHGLALLPIIDAVAGPGDGAVRLLGLAPEPTVVFTCGWLLTRQPEWRLAAAALLPAIAGGMAGYSAYALAWPPDWVVLLAAVAALVLAPNPRLAGSR